MGADVSASNVPKRAQYSLNDIAELVIEAHSCIHRMDEKLDAHQLEVAKELGLVRERVAKMEGRSEAVAQRLGVVENAPQQKPAWFPKPWQVAAGVLAGASGFVVLYKIGYPALVAAHHAIMAYH